MVLAVSALTSCKEKKNTGDIIVTKIVKKAPVQTEAMSPWNFSKNVEWLATVYKVTINRYSDKSLPQAKDESGNKYFDNKITLRILRKDGSTFIDKTFTKADFGNYLSEDMKQNGALLGLMLNKAEGDNLIFTASVGSPDKLSDEYIPLTLKISRTGGVIIDKSRTEDAD